jgi:hypothetical protein
VSTGRGGELPPAIGSSRPLGIQRIREVHHATTSRCDVVVLGEDTGEDAILVAGMHTDDVRPVGELREQRSAGVAVTCVAAVFDLCEVAGEVVVYRRDTGLERRPPALRDAAKVAD